jgi:hypothetical protein
LFLRDECLGVRVDAPAQIMALRGGHARRELRVTTLLRSQRLNNQIL